MARPGSPDPPGRVDGLRSVLHPAGGIWPRADDTPELIDHEVPSAERRRTLGDVSRLNALFLGRRCTLIHVKRLLARFPGERTATVLDVGTGAADIPRALARWARRARRRLRIVALDRDHDTLDRVARKTVAGYPEISLVRGDALALPIAPRGVDIVISAMTLHHLEPDAAVGYFRAMAAATRVGFVVNDLARSRRAYLLVWLVTRVLARSPISRHDGPLSVRRSYTTTEVTELCRRAGILDVVVHRYPIWLRQCAVWGQS
ncbi:MAG: methyltransferase domain-containing protein [Candidatus Rokubacteria bacterium]|nr:methyltransferase domain-containing protein [Candidatus Rokubacteria bacterium]